MIIDEHRGEINILIARERRNYIYIGILSTLVYKVQYRQCDFIFCINAATNEASRKSLLPVAIFIYISKQSETKATFFPSSPSLLFILNFANGKIIE